MEADDIPRITAKDAATAVSGGALLVCAYETEEWCREADLAGSISLHEFRKLRPKIPKDRTIIFYCECPAEESSVREARKNRSLGFLDVRALLGGVEGWKAAGLDLVLPDATARA